MVGARTGIVHITDTTVITIQFIGIPKKIDTTLIKIEEEIITKDRCIKPEELPVILLTDIRTQEQEVVPLIEATTAEVVEHRVITEVREIAVCQICVLRYLV